MYVATNVAAEYATSVAADTILDRLTSEIYRNPHILRCTNTQKLATHILCYFAFLKINLRERKRKRRHISTGCAAVDIADASLSFGHHVHSNGGIHIGMQVNVHGVFTHSAQRAGRQTNFLLLHRQAGGGHRLSDVDGTDRTE